MSKKRWAGLAALVSLLSTSVHAQFGGGFFPLTNYLQALDPLFLYSRLQPLVDFTILFIMFFAIGRIAFAKFGDGSKQIATALGLALAGGGVIFLFRRGVSLFGIMGNFSMLLVLILMGLFLYFAFPGLGAQEGVGGWKKGGLAFLFVLIILRASFNQQWFVIIPSPMLRAIIELFIAVGSLVFLIYFVIWFFNDVRSALDSNAPEAKPTDPEAWNRFKQTVAPNREEKKKKANTSDEGPQDLDARTERDVVTKCYILERQCHNALELATMIGRLWEAETPKKLADFSNEAQDYISAFRGEMENIERGFGDIYKIIQKVHKRNFLVPSTAYQALAHAIVHYGQAKAVFSDAVGDLK